MLTDAGLSHKSRNTAGHQWLKPIILASWEAEIKRIMVQDQPANSSWDSISENNQSKKNGIGMCLKQSSICFVSVKLWVQTPSQGWRFSSSGNSACLQSWGSEFLSLSLAALGFELRASHLLCRCSASPVLCCVFSKQSLMNYLPELAFNLDPPDLCLLSSWDYRMSQTFLF
jgi:hypothetical protein